MSEMIVATILGFILGAIVGAVIMVSAFSTLRDEQIKAGIFQSDGVAYRIERLAQ